MQDGSNKTFWHTRFAPTVAAPPHFVILENPRGVEIKGLSYATWSGGNGNGQVKKYSIYFSEDGKTWGEPIIDGDLEVRLANEQPILFPEKTTKRYIKFLVQDAVTLDGKSLASVGKLDVIVADKSKSERTKVTVEVESAESEEKLRRAVQRFAERAFATRLSDEELLPYYQVALLQRSEGDFVQAAKAGFKAIVCSPRFLMVPGEHESPALAKAADLARVLWLSVPDADLLESAESKEFSEGAFRSQIDRMIRNKKFDRMIESFCDQWLNLRTWDNVSPSLKLYPIRTRDVEQLMATLELATPGAKLRMEDNGRRLVAWATPQEQTKVQAVLDQLKASTAGAGQGSSQLQTYQIERVQPSTAKALLEELLPNARITANDEGKTLIVIGTLDDHQAVKTLVTQIDGQKRERSAKTYSTKGISSERLSAVVTTLVPLATLSIDAKTDTVVVVASDEEHKRFSSVIEQLTSTATVAKTELKTYPTSEIDVPSVTALLATLVPKASVTVDETNQRFVVIASADDHAKVANVLAQVTQAPESARELTPYPLPPNQSTDTVTGLLASIAPSADVTVDAANKRFLVVANAKEHALILKTLEQLAAGVSQQRELKPYPLAEGQSSETITSLLSSLAPEATVTPDTTNNRLLIVATPDEHAKVATTIEQFGNAAPDDELQFYSIDATVDATTVLPLMSELVPNATVKQDAANKQLAVVASATDHAKIKNILEQASSIPVMRRELKTYALGEQQDTETLTSLLSSLVPDASVTVDAVNRRLLIVASEDEHAQAAKMLEQLGGENGVAPELRFYPVQQEILSGVTTVLSSIAPAAQITLDETAKRLSVVARADEHDRIKVTLQKLTLAAAADEKPGMQLYDVTSAQRRRFTTVVEGLTAQLPGLQVLASGDPRELTIWAKPSQHAVVTRILDQLKRDIPLDRKPILAVYPITKVDAAGVQTALSELFPDAQITLDEKASRLLIKAVPDEQKAIDAAVRQLDTDSPVSTKIKLMAYPVDGLTSSTVVSAIEAELPNVSVIPDTAAETLIVRGQLREHEKVAAIIDALRSSAGTLRKRRVVAYPAVFGNPLQTITFINTAFEGARAVVDSTSGRMTVWATEQQHKEIAAAVAEMSGAAGGELAPVTKSYQLKGLSSTTLTAMLGRAVPDAKVVVDAAGSRMVAWAREADQKTIESIINGAADADRSGRALQIFEIEPARLPTTQQVLADANSDITFMPAATGNALLAWTSEEQAKQIRDTIERLTKSEVLSTKRELRTFSVKDINPDSARSLLGTVFPTVVFTDSPDGQSLVANVTVREATAIADSLQQLKANGVIASKREMKFYNFKDIGGAEARALIARAVPDVSFTGQEDRMVAWVLPSEDEKIASLLEELRTKKPFDRGRSLKTYSVQGLGANASSVLQDAVPGASISTGISADQLFVRGTANEHAEIGKVLEHLQAAVNAAPKPELKTYNIEGLDATAVQTTLAPLVDASVQLTIDPTGRQLYVRAFAEKQKEIGSLIESVINSLPSRKGVSTKSYRVLIGDADEVAETVQALYPNAVVVTDRDRKVVVATALPKEHETIKEIVDQLVADGGESRVTAKTYPIKAGNGLALQTTLRAMYLRTEAKFSYDATSQSLLAVARDDQHAEVQKLIEQMKADAAAIPKKELATFNIEGLDALSLTKTLTPLVGDDAEVTADPTGRRLYVRAVPAQRAEVEKLVQSVIDSLPSRKGVSTKSYRVSIGEADEVAETVQALYPDVVAVTDRKREVVVATALPEEHATIQQVVDQMVADGGKSQVSAKTYPLRNADGVALARSLGLMYRQTEAQISFDSGTKTLLAVARKEQHQAIQALVDQLEGARTPEDNRTVQFYSLEGADGLAVRSVVQDLLDQVDPKSSVVNDEGSQQLVVTTIAEGHDKVKDAISRLQQQKVAREIEVFQLSRLEPLSAELAVESLFDDGNVKLRDLPVLQSDNDSQQLIVRGTTEQIDQIRDLLVKMGETGLRKTDANAKVRVIPVTGDAADAIRSLEKVWPKIRRNPIKVLQPGSRVKELVPDKEVNPKSLPKREGRAPTDRKQAGSQVGTTTRAQVFMYTSTRESVTAQPMQQDDQLAPVLIVPGNGRITISSDDTEALNQMEAVLRAVFSSRGSSRRKDFTVYGLTNAAASTVSDVLNNIFKRDDSPITFGNVVVVPDQRLNALIVFAGRVDRERIEQLIEILDSDNIPETVATARTSVISVEHADAARINTVLAGIYKAQMSAGGSRQQVAIPKGVPTAVATVLRQINAASSAPLLNIQVDETTNSLVVMAPQNLLEEVTELVERLDNAASTSRARGVSIIELQKTNSRRVMEVLDRVLKK